MNNINHSHRSSETDMSNKIGGEFKGTIIRILAGLEKIIECINKTFARERKYLRKSQ